MKRSGRFPVLMAFFVLAIALVRFCQTESAAPAPGRYYSESSVDSRYLPEFSPVSDSGTGQLPIRSAQWTEADGLPSPNEQGVIHPASLTGNSVSNPTAREDSRKAIWFHGIKSRPVFSHAHCWISRFRTSKISPPALLMLVSTRFSLDGIKTQRHFEHCVP